MRDHEHEFCAGNTYPEMCLYDGIGPHRVIDGVHRWLKSVALVNVQITHIVDRSAAVAIAGTEDPYGVLCSFDQIDVGRVDQDIVLVHAAVHYVKAALDYSFRSISEGLLGEERIENKQ